MYIVPVYAQLMVVPSTKSSHYENTPIQIYRKFHL